MHVTDGGKDPHLDVLCAKGSFRHGDLFALNV